VPGNSRRKLQNFAASFAAPFRSVEKIKYYYKKGGKTNEAPTFFAFV
jgi:hypothetical protein